MDHSCEWFSSLVGDTPSPKLYVTLQPVCHCQRFIMSVDPQHDALVPGLVTAVMLKVGYRLLGTLVGNLCKSCARLFASLKSNSGANSSPIADWRSDQKIFSSLSVVARTRV